MNVNDVESLGLMQSHPGPIPPYLPLTNTLKAKPNNKMSKHYIPSDDKVTSLIQREIADLLGIGIAPTSRSPLKCR